MLTVSEAAERLGLSPKTVYRLCGQRRIAHNRMGRAVRIPEAAVEDYLASTSQPVEDKRAAPAPKQPAKKGFHVPQFITNIG